MNGRVKYREWRHSGILFYSHDYVIFNGLTHSTRWKQYKTWWTFIWSFFKPCGRVDSWRLIKAGFCNPAHRVRGVCNEGRIPHYKFKDNWWFATITSLEVLTKEAKTESFLKYHQHGRVDVATVTIKYRNCYTNVFIGFVSDIYTTWWITKKTMFQ